MQISWKYLHNYCITFGYGRVKRIYGRIELPPSEVHSRKFKSVYIKLLNALLDIVDNIKSIQSCNKAVSAFVIRQAETKGCRTKFIIYMVFLMGMSHLD